MFELRQLGGVKVRVFRFLSPAPPSPPEKEEVIYCVIYLYGLVKGEGYSRGLFVNLLQHFGFWRVSVAMYCGVLTDQIKWVFLKPNRLINA